VRGPDYDGPIVPDGKLHRFKAQGDHLKNSWACCTLAHPPPGSLVVGNGASQGRGESAANLSRMSSGRPSAKAGGVRR
jgi:hypothetical protein